MFPFRSNPPSLPEGFLLDIQNPPSPIALNRLLSKCKEKTHPPKRLSIAIQKSLCNLSIFEVTTGRLSGFVRATTDYGLNANLWNLVAEPGPYQARFLTFLVHRVMLILRRDLPGCSISVSSPQIAIQALKANGFLIDPNGIRSMGIRLK